MSLFKVFRLLRFISWPDVIGEAGVSACVPDKGVYERRLSTK